MRTTIGATLIAVCCGTLAPAAARADAQGGATAAAIASTGGGGGGGGSAAATGFLLEGALAFGTSVGATETSTGIGIIGISGSLRAGYMADALALALDIAYSSASVEDEAGNSNYQGSVMLGPLAQIFLWQSADRAARLYALAGVSFGDAIERTNYAEPLLPDTSDDTFMAALNLGFGGCYFLQRNFTLGLELGSKTNFIGTKDTLYLSIFYAALTIGFVAG